MRRTTISLLAIAGLAGLPAFSNAASDDAPPNIIVILADDLGYGDVSCYNPESKIQTPRVDRLAAEGMRFTDAHAPSAVCTPTRYSLLTGRYAWRTALRAHVLGPWAAPLISPERLTVGALLGRHGYTTACIGKWHLGLTWPTKDGGPPFSDATAPLSNVDFTRPLAAGPTTRGFDYYFGVDVPNFPPYCFIEDDCTVGDPNVPQDWPEKRAKRIGPMTPGWKLVDILPGLTRRAVRYVEDAAKSSPRRPFFLYLSLTSPHYPVVPAPEFVGKSGAGGWGDFVVQTDWSVGQVLDEVERSGLAENTLVILTSDNGPEITPEITENEPSAYERLQRFGHSSMGALRGVKRDVWEGGHRVPFVARWPGRIACGAVSDETICLVDFVATAAALVGEKLPDDAGEDSYNLLPVLLGMTHATPLREATVLHSRRTGPDGGKFAIRKGDWVLIDSPTGRDNPPEPEWFNRQRGYTPHDEPGELFNLREDPAQRHNRYGELPQLVRKLKDLLARYKRDGRSTPGAPQPNDVSLELP